MDRALSVLKRGDERDLADLFLLEAGPAGLTAARLALRLGVFASSAASLLDALTSSGKALRIAPALYAHAGAAASLAERATAAFAERKKSGTASVSFGKSEFEERLARGLSPAAVDGWIAVLAASKVLALDGDRVVEPGAKAADLEGVAASFAAKISEGYRAAGFEPPRLPDLAAAVGTKPAIVDGLVSHLVKSGILVRLSPDLVVHRDVAAAAEKKLESVTRADARRGRLPGPPRAHAQDAHPAARVLRLEKAHAAIGRCPEGRVDPQRAAARRFFFTTRSLFFFAESSV